jgi:WXG100 family type VII secretion target
VSGESAQDRAAMAKAAGDIDEAASTIKGLQTSLHGHKAAVLAGWQGNAAHAFDGVFTSFDEDMTKVLTALNGMHEKLVHNRTQYEAAEEQQTDAAKAIHQFLNH